jgi:hypothetical protein
MAEFLWNLHKNNRQSHIIFDKLEKNKFFDINTLKKWGGEYIMRNVEN